MEIVSTEQHTALRGLLVGFIGLFLTYFYFPDFLESILISNESAGYVNFLIIFGYIIAIGFFFGFLINFPMIKKIILWERVKGLYKKVDEPVFSLLNETMFRNYNGIKYNLIKTKYIDQIRHRFHDSLFFTDEVPEYARNRIHNYNSLYFFISSFFLMVVVFFVTYLLYNCMFLTEGLDPIKLVPLAIFLIYPIKINLQNVSLAQEESVIALHYYNKRKTEERIKSCFNYLRKEKNIIPKNIFVVITCINEGQILKKTTSGCEKVLNELKNDSKIDSFKIIIVKDKGIDPKTDKVVEELGKVNRAIIYNSESKGQGAAWKKALSELKKNKSEGILLLIDGDGQYPPDDISHYLIPILDGNADMVIGTKYLLRKTEESAKKAFDDVYLFSIDTGVEEKLNKGVISKGLRNKFKTEGYPLSKNRIVGKEKDGKWEITDEGTVYIVKKEDGKLKIYGYVRIVNEKKWVGLARKKLKTNFTDLQAGIKAIRLDSIGDNKNQINIEKFKSSLYDTSLHEALCIEGYNKLEVLLECPVCIKKSRKSSLSKEYKKYKRAIDLIIGDLLKYHPLRALRIAIHQVVHLAFGSVT